MFSVSIAPMTDQPGTPGAQAPETLHRLSTMIRKPCNTSHPGGSPPLAAI